MQELPKVIAINEPPILLREGGKSFSKILKWVKKRWDEYELESLFSAVGLEQKDLNKALFIRALNNVNLTPRAKHAFYRVINGNLVGCIKHTNKEWTFYKKNYFTPAWVFEGFIDVAKLMVREQLSKEEIYQREVETEIIPPYVEEKKEEDGEERKVYMGEIDYSRQRRAKIIYHHNGPRR